MARKFIPLQNLVDELGTLKAKIADLTARENEIKTALIDSGHSEIDGILFRVTVSHSTRETLDRKAVEKVLMPDVLASCLKRSAVTTVRVNARVSTPAHEGA